MTKPYSDYKETGIPWLNRIPSHWDAKRLRRTVDLVTEKGEENSQAIALEHIASWSGELLKIEGEYSGQGVSFKKEDILFGKLRPYLAKVALADQDGNAVGDFHVLRPQPSTDGRFMQLQLLTSWFISVVDGSTYGAKMPRASWSFMSGIVLAFPPLPEQRAIAAFLDRETTKIDALVDEQRRLIELLKEKRQAVISHAVTKGLDPSVPMKDSGVEWLGEIPAHWDFGRLKNDLDFITSGSRGWASYYDDSGELFLRIGNLTRDSLELNLSEEQRVKPPKGSEGERTSVKAGDLNRSGFAGGSSS